MSRARAFKELLDSLNSMQSKREQFYSAVENLVSYQDAEIGRLRAEVERLTAELKLVHALYVAEGDKRDKAEGR